MTKPISRYWNFGVTFRWIRGDSHITVLRGYVNEGRAIVVVRRAPFEVRDRPWVDPHNDPEQPVATIPVNPSEWGNDRYFVDSVHRWAYNNPRLVEPDSRTDEQKGNPFGLQPRFPAR